MSGEVRKAVILARGLGTRMRAAAADAPLSAEQAAVAATGVKALMPFSDGRTVLDLITERLRLAGFSQICLVIGPEHEAIRSYCRDRGLDVDFAVQQEALGTADAVLAAEEWVGEDELFAVVNSDNLYPVEVLQRLRDANRPAMPAFEREGLVAESNVPEERIAKFATVETDASRRLVSVIEKPEEVASDSLISMNAWLLPRAIFQACRSIEPSVRGEYEITSAVQYAIDEMGVAFDVFRVRAGVLDLSNRSDIAAVERMLEREA